MSLTIREAVNKGKLVFKDWIKAFTPELFEVNFSDVIAGRGKIYSDPDELFSNTYLTERMKDVLRWCLARAARQSEKGIIHLATGFGGGKSHLLSLLYHTFRSRRVIDPHILDELSLREVPDVEMVAVDGHNLAYPMSSHQSLGKYLKPTKDETVRALESAGKPVVFLIDELVVYLAKIKESEASSELAHLHTLMESVKSTPGCLMVISSPSGSAAYGKEAEQLDQVVQKSRTASAALSLTSIANRVTEPIVPVEAADFPSILKKRLVEYLDDYTAKEVEHYLGRLVGGAGLDFSGCYPFHPLLTDILYTRASQFPGFQKTRDSLKVVALAVKGVLRNLERAEFHMISPSEMPFDDPDLKSILTNEKVFGVNLEQAVTKDILGTARTRLDGGAPYGSYARAASAVFMYSLHPEESKKGALPENVFRCMAPTVKSKDDAEKLLENLYKESDFVWKSEGRYLFKSRQNVPNMIKTRANQVTEHEVKEYVRNTLFQDVFKDDARCAFFSDPSFFSPSENRLNVLVAMYWEDNLQDIAKAALSITASKKNAIVALLPNKDQAGLLTYYAKQVLGAEKVIKELRADKALYGEARALKDQFEGNALSAFKNMYSEVWYLSGTNIKQEKIDPARGNTFADALVDLLRRKQKLADPSTIDPSVYIPQLMGVRDRVPVRDLYNDVETMTTLPFAFREDLRKILSVGVRDGVVGAFEGVLPPLQDLTKYNKCHFREVYEVQDGDTIVKPDLATELLKRLEAIADGGKADTGMAGVTAAAGIGAGTAGIDTRTTGIGTGGIGSIGGGAAGVGATTTTHTEREVIVANISDLYDALSKKTTELMINGVEYELEAEFTGAISGRLTAKTPEETSAMVSLIQALSGAAKILPSVKSTVIIIKRVGSS